MSALWTPGRAGVSPGFLVAEPGAVEPPPQLPPTLRRLPHPTPATRVPSHVTNVMTSNIELYLVPARRPAGHGSTPAPPRVGLLHEGRDPLTTGCAYCTKAPPTRSTPNPHPVDPDPRALRPDDTSSHPSNCEQPGRPHQRSEQWLPHTVGPPHQRLEMPRHPKLPEDMRQHRG